MYMQGIGRLHREEGRTRVRIMAKCQHSQICNNVPTETLTYIILQEHGLVPNHWRLSSGECYRSLDNVNRGHDNVHDDMNMYVILYDQCLFIAMINSFHT